RRTPTRRVRHRRPAAGQGRRPRRTRSAALGPVAQLRHRLTRLERATPHRPPGGIVLRLLMLLPLMTRLALLNDGATAGGDGGGTSGGEGAAETAETGGDTPAP